MGTLSIPLFEKERHFYTEFVLGAMLFLALLVVRWGIIMRKDNALDLSQGAIVYCQRSGRRCEVLRHFVFSNIDHVVVTFDGSELTPRQINLSTSATKDRFVSTLAGSEQNINFLPKLLAS